jgi:hypothetical protein
MLYCGIRRRYVQAAPTPAQSRSKTGEATASITARVSAEPNQIRKHARRSVDHDLFSEWNPIDRWTRFQFLWDRYQPSTSSSHRSLAYLIIRRRVFKVNPPPGLFPQNLRQLVDLRLTWPPLVRLALIGANVYDGYHPFLISIPMYDSVVGDGRIDEGYLRVERLNARQCPHDSHPGAQKCYLVVGAIIFDVVFGVIDEPILQNIIAVETDATFGVGVKIG